MTTPRSLGRRRMLSGMAGLSAALALHGLSRRADASDAAARVTLLHVNDFHSRHEPILSSAAACRPNAPCYGGSARLVATVKAERSAAEAAGRAVLALDVGDQFMGSLFYTHHRGLAEAAIQRAWGCEAMALGNHEFDHGPGTLARFAEALRVPLLAANLDTRAEPALDGRVRPWMVIERGGARIALIGLITEDTPTASSPGPDLRFTSAEEAVERSIAEIGAAGAPATVVVLSHCGLSADRRLAARVRGVDVILGGHSHTLLANGLEGAEGPHPLLVDGPDRPVRIVQAGAHGRWLGRLELELSTGGRVLGHGGNAVELRADMPEDPEAAQIVARFAAPLEEARRRPVAAAAAGFDNASCRVGECAIGNLIAEAMLAAVPGADVALQNGGGIRAALPEGVVTYGHVLGVLPFGNTLATARLRGGDLLAALENGLSQPGAGRFPQVAGIRLVWDPARPAGQRILSAELRTGPVDPDRVYLLATNNFLRGGGDGYAPLRDGALEFYDTGPLLEEVVAAWLAAQAPVTPRLDGRLTAR